MTTLERLIFALRPFARLGCPDFKHGITAYHDLEDDVVVFNDGSGKVITAGEVREAGAAIQDLL